MRTPEGIEKAKIKKYLDSIGAWHFSPFMAGYGKIGVPDIIACWHGRFIGIEVKREGKLPTPIQQRRMVEIRSHGGLALSGTAGVVINALRTI